MSSRSSYRTPPSTILSDALEYLSSWDHSESDASICSDNAFSSMSATASGESKVVTRGALDNYASNTRFLRYRAPNVERSYEPLRGIDSVAQPPMKGHTRHMKTREFDYLPHFVPGGRTIYSGSENSGTFASASSLLRRFPPATRCTADVFPESEDDPGVEGDRSISIQLQQSVSDNEDDSSRMMSGSNTDNSGKIHPPWARKDRDVAIIPMSQAQTKDSVASPESPAVHIPSPTCEVLNSLCSDQITARDQNPSDAAQPEAAVSSETVASSTNTSGGLCGFPPFKFKLPPPGYVYSFTGTPSLPDRPPVFYPPPPPRPREEDTPHVFNSKHPQWRVYRGFSSFADMFKRDVEDGYDADESILTSFDSDVEV